MQIYVPEDFKLVDKADFEDYLKGCPDYERDGWCGGISYRFKHNRRVFAVDLENGTVMVEPVLLVPH